MGKLRPKLDTVAFVCPTECGYRWEAPPAEVIDAPEDEWHPWRYGAPCPLCGAEAEQCRQQRGLLKAWAHATGPKTPAGRRTVAKNLPEDTQRSRFNALRHGIYARTATYFPARPGGYPECEGCEFRFTSCTSAEACQKKTELFFRHHLAFEQNDPTVLREIHADLQASVTALMHSMLVVLVGDGVKITAPKHSFDGDGKLRLAKYLDEEGNEHTIEEIRAHPLLKPLTELLAKNNLTLADLAMTPKITQEAEIVRGQLEADDEERSSAVDFRERTVSALEHLGDLVRKSQQEAAKDPVLIEHQGTLDEASE